MSLLEKIFEVKVVKPEDGSKKLTSYSIERVKKEEIKDSSPDINWNGVMWIIGCVIIFTIVGSAGLWFNEQGRGREKNLAGYKKVIYYILSGPFIWIGLVFTLIRSIFWKIVGYGEYICKKIESLYIRIRNSIKKSVNNFFISK